ncbi:MAG: homocysteine S-methyltransferase family protein [Acidobacteriota bacterium]|jgi:5-methyltetrahydrofolate--homocysteine methyltransferase|nr:homocysteine S-methyltransferase family protein [Acidobacteriota bacterium]NLT32554.1 hypothetical protein [Acidobacteriota bacterium]
MTLATLIATAERPLLLDGGMGTQLGAAGLPMGAETCLSHPDAVGAVHRAYVDAGADLVITHTLTLNRIAAQAAGLDVDISAGNRAAAGIARRETKGGQYVLGDIGTTGKLLAPVGPLTEKDARAAYLEQAAALAEGGVDGFIVETMISLPEALVALSACREAAPALPVLVSMTFKATPKGARTVMGDSVPNCARALEKGGATAVGSNCGDLTPLEMAALVPLFRESCSLPVMIQPNAGRPLVVDGRTVFRMTPEDFAAGTMHAVEAGARLVGGCCGTTPAHIRALARLLRGGE